VNSDNDGTYRPDGAGVLIGSGFYKDVALGGVVLQTRFKLLHSHLTPLPCKSIFCGMNFTQSRLLPIVLLTGSNIFMTFAWYGHLKFKDKPLLLVILASWGIAFFEYCLQVPANRWGNSVYSAAQLKIIQEIITLSVFVVFAMLYLHEKIRWNYVAAFVCILAAVAFAFWPKN
jgi:uncharacterized protein (DUF486 family)